VASAGCGRIEAPSGLGYGDGCPLPSRLGGLGSVVNCPAGSGAKPQLVTHFGSQRAIIFAPIINYDIGTKRSCGLQNSRLYADALSLSHSVSCHATYQVAQLSNCCKPVTKILVPGGGVKPRFWGNNCPPVTQRRIAPILFMK